MEKYVRSMKCLFYFLCVQVWPIFSICLGMLDTNRFVVVSNILVADQFYRKIHDTKPRFYNERNIGVDVKRRICTDIMSNDLFRKYWSNKKITSSHLPNLIVNFEHPTERIQVRISSEHPARFDEMAFACLVRKFGCRLKTYYISEEYNLYANRDGGPSSEYAAARFIFKKRKGHRKSYFLFGLAEPAGNAFLSPDHGIERLYLQRRKNYSILWEPDEDALCRLGPVDRRRVCVAVFESNYFEGRVQLPTNNTTSCSLKKISYQTEYGQKKAKKQFYTTERMLDCDHYLYEQYGDRKNKFEYLLSHAYESNQVFVFFRNSTTGEIFLENLTVNIRLTYVPQQSSDPQISNRTSQENSEEFKFGSPFPFEPVTFFGRTDLSS